MRRETQFNVVLIELNPDLAGVLSFALQSLFGATVFECADSDLAGGFLETVPKVDMLVVQDQEASHSFLVQQGGVNPISVILCVKDGFSDSQPPLYPGVIGVARQSMMIDDVIDLVRKRFFQGVILEELAPSDFCQINPRLLLRIFPLVTDVYIRLAGGKHLKLFNKGSLFEPSDFDRFVTHKRIDYFYVKRSDSSTLLGRLRVEVRAAIQHGPLDSERITDLTTDILESVHDMVMNIGVTDEVREMTQSNVQLVLRIVDANMSLANILERFRQEPSRYIPQHSLALAEIACAFAGAISWVSDLTFQKLILASLFHDISLKNHEMARARTLEEVMTHKEWVYMETIEDFKNHPNRSAELVSQLNDVPSDVETMIRQHHERPEGSGFPLGINHTKFTPLASLFVIAHDFLDFYQNLEKNRRAGAFEKFLKQSESEYSFGHFRQIFRDLAGSAKGESPAHD